MTAGVTAAAVVVLIELASGRVAIERGEVRQRVTPGSTIKPFVLEAAKGLPPFERVCQRTVRLGGRRMDCTHPRLALPVGAREALVYSCNSYFASLGKRIEPERLAATLKRFGFVVARSAESEVERQLMALGEFGVTTTPLDLARAYARLAADGGVAGLREAVEVGTAQRAAVEGLAVAGKTGTTRGHAWFAGYAPADRPRVAVVVLTLEGTGGASAAPVAAEVLKQWFARR